MSILFETKDRQLQESMFLEAKDRQLAAVVGVGSQEPDMKTRPRLLLQ
jgi:hypothetical protein